MFSKVISKRFFDSVQTLQLPTQYSKRTNFTYNLICYLFLFFAITVGGKHLAAAAIFGADNRTTSNESSPHFQLSRATAVAVLKSLHSESNGLVKLEADSMKDSLCRDERYSFDPSLNYACTGFLVAPDLIVTAGHCMVNVGESRNETELYCDAFDWLFDYRTSVTGQTNLDKIPSDKIYKCKQVIYAIREEEAPYRDYALVQLARPVLDRQPLKISPQDPTENQLRSENFTMIGYPFGTPAKISPNGKLLLNNVNRQSFLTNLSAFAGNSGGPVLNRKNEVIGILIGGTPSNNTFDDTKNKCERYNRCDVDGKNCALPDDDTSVFPGYQGVGSEVQRIGPIIELIKIHNSN